MSRQIIDLGTLPYVGGDSPRTAGGKINDNFTELYPYFTRERLAADVTLYVATTGNDSNDGLTVGSPFLTIQKGVNTALANYIVPSGKRVTVQLANGTYTLSSPITIRGQRFGSEINPYRSLVIIGNTGSPGSVIVQSSLGNVFLIYNQFVEIQGMELRCTAAGSACVWAENFGRASLSSMRLGPSVGSQAHINLFYNSYLFTGALTVSGGSARFLNLSYNSHFRKSGTTLTFSGGPTFSSTLMAVNQGSLADLASVTYSGAITGSQYIVGTLGMIASTNTVPGTAGSTGTGGRVINTSWR